ncbi:Aspartic protease snp2 [Pleosporales sp. CAS-2024a]
MPSLTSIVLALAASGAVVASPVQKRAAFTVEQVQKGQHIKYGADAMAKAFRKYGKTVPRNIEEASANFRAKYGLSASSHASTGSVSALPSDNVDSSYLCAVNVGGTTLNLDFDTGSSDLWAFSSLQPRSQIGSHDSYTVNPSKQLKGYTWQISYGDQSGASGLVYADQVTVGGVTATSQAVEAATSVSSEFVQDSSDGLLGLAFSSINTVQPQSQTTFFDTVHDQLAQPLFAATLKYHAAGTYDFGFIDSSKYTGSITYVDVDNSQGFWGFSADGYSIGGNAQGGAAINNAILDTGTTLILVDDSVVSNYYSQVNGAQLDNSQGGYTFPCDATLPDFAISVGGVDQTVPGQYINFAPADGNTCFGGIQSNAGIGNSIFGDVFLKSKYIVFDMNDNATPRAGFAEQAAN